MSWIPPTQWVDVPRAVREALLDPFEKKADGEGLPGIRHLADVMGWKAGPMNAFWGGPRPLTNLIIGAGLGGLGGYGMGRLAENVLPEKYFNPGAIRKRTAIIGAALGGVPAVWQGYDNVRQSGNLSSILDRWPHKEAIERTAEFQKEWRKEAADLFEPMIGRTDFNQKVFQDPWTPLPLQAATAGLVEAASATRGGGEWVSPFDVARVAIGAGVGAVSGIVAGKALGFLAGLSPEGQKGVQNIGLWSGLLKATVPQALGLR